MGGLDWEKANRKEGLRRRPKGKKRRFDRQPYLQDFVWKHKIRCFRCGTTEAQWAKTGIGKRGAWCICTDCVQAAH